MIIIGEDTKENNYFCMGTLIEWRTKIMMNGSRMGQKEQSYHKIHESKEIYMLCREEIYRIVTEKREEDDNYLS